MTALYIVGGLVLLVVLLLSGPISLRFYYYQTPLCVLRIWGIPVRLLPRTEKKRAVSKQTAAPKQEEKRFELLDRLQQSFQEDGVAATLSWLGEIAKLLTETTGRVLRDMRVRLLRIELRIGGEDASAAAIHFGEVCAVLYPLLSIIGSQMRIQKRMVEVRPDFENEGTAALLDMRCGISLWKVCGALLASLLKFSRIQQKQTDNSDR